MAPFRYRLQTLLEQRLERKQEAERELAVARQKLRDVQLQLAELSERQKALEAERFERRRSVLPAESAGMEVQRRIDDLGLLARRIEDVKDEVMSARLQVEECVEQADRACARLAKATRELEILKKHREKCEKRFRSELERKTAAEHDEIASAMYETRRRS